MKVKESLHIQRQHDSEVTLQILVQFNTFEDQFSGACSAIYQRKEKIGDTNNRDVIDCLVKVPATNEAEQRVW